MASFDSDLRILSRSNSPGTHRGQRSVTELRRQALLCEWYGYYARSFSLPPVLRASAPLQQLTAARAPKAPGHATWCGLHTIRLVGVSIATLWNSRGYLLGGAGGDALGASVEFMSIEQIHDRFGPGAFAISLLRTGGSVR